MTKAFAEILKWVSKLDYWEQVAFDLLVSGKEITKDDIGFLVEYLLEEKGLIEKDGDRPDLKFKEYLLAHEECAPYKLTRISNLRNINALVENQTLEFGPNLTAIFGGNGSGKSGYARVLGSAGFTRGDEEIIPDINKPFNSDTPQLVDIELDCEGELVPIEYEIGTPCPQMASFYVFDSTSVVIHLTKENTISFSPIGLSYLRELAVLTDRVRDELKHQVDERNKPNIYQEIFQGDSIVQKKISSLSHETIIEELKSLANFISSDEDTLKKLKKQISIIETKGIPTKIKELEQNKKDLSQLVQQIKMVNDGLGKENITKINQDIKSLNGYLGAANQLGLEKFKAGKLSTVGSEEWQDFIHAAKLLSTIEVKDAEHPYPHDDSYCLLCQQTLSSDSKELIVQLWEYLGSETQIKLKDAEEQISNWIGAVNKLNTAFYKDQLAISRFVLDRDKNLNSTIKSYRDSCINLKKNVNKCIKNRQEIEYSGVASDFVSKIETLISQVDEEIAGWSKQVGQIDTLYKKVREYEHRKLLLKYFDEIESYIKELIWANNASKIGGSTTHITRKYNQMFSELVTDEYVKLFEQTLEDIGQQMKVHIETRARKGEVFKQLVLEADESTPEKLARPDKILSEGEKRAVALADFLTEISLDKSSRGIILDDPVTSLDISWRRKFAEVLAGEAKDTKDRQVIVFTHDMPFLYYLREACEKAGVPIDNHWIKRGDYDDFPGYVYLNNSPVLEQDYKNDRVARRCYEKAKDAAPKDQLACVREGFGVLRTSYEVLIMYDLFKGVVKRFEERTSFMNLKNVVWDEDLANEVVGKCELCSSLMEGHSHSDAYTTELPTPKYLLTEIEEFNRIKKAINSLKK